MKQTIELFFELLTGYQMIKHELKCKFELTKTDCQIRIKKATYEGGKKDGKIELLKAIQNA